MAARVVSRIVRLEMIIVLLGHWRRWGRERRFSFLARTTVPRWNQSRRSRLAVGPHGVPKSRRHRGIVGPGVLHHLRRSLTPMARGSKRVAGPLWDVGAALSADQLYEMQSLMATERTGVYMDPSSVASTPFFGFEVRLLPYIRPLPAASSYRCRAIMGYSRASSQSLSRP